MQNPWDAVKAVLRGKFIEIQAYFKKQEKHQTSNLNQKKNNSRKQPKVSRSKEIIQTTVGKNEKEMKETIAKINKSKRWSFEKINKIDKPLAKLKPKKVRRLK